MMIAQAPKLPKSSVLVMAALLLIPSMGSAQYRPGIERGDYWGDVRSKYRSETLERVGGLMDGWLQIWNGPDVADGLDEMMNQFAEEGVLVLDGTVFNGADRIRGALEARPHTQITQSLTDFDVRGEMAFVAARYRAGTSRDRGALVGGGAKVALWVFVKEGKDWRIRSLVIDLVS